MDGQTNRWMDGWRDGGMHKSIHEFQRVGIYIFFSAGVRIRGELGAAPLALVKSRASL